MSYLGFPRIHFAGRFQADVSTVNNDVRHFDVDQFRSDFQQPMEVKNETIVDFNGYWNPEGSGAFRLLNCKITSAVLDGRVCTRPKDDPVIGLVVVGSNDRVAAKLVDLDPQQQFVSQIWGLSVCLVDENGVAAFRGEFGVAPFIDLWRRQHGDVFYEQHLAAAYQSILADVKWFDFANSPCLTALEARSDRGLLSIRMNVFGYDRTPGASDFGAGRVTGTIGPAVASEPKHFVLGRQLTASLAPDLSAANNVCNIQAKVHESTESVCVDFGNALPIINPAGDLEDLGSLAFGILKDASVEQGAALAADQFVRLGTIPYRGKNWLFKTAGVADFRFGENPAAKALIHDHPLAVVKLGDKGQYTVLNRETVDGLYVRADAFVYRLNPSDSTEIDFYATKYGRPLATTVSTQPTDGGGIMGGAGTGDTTLSIPVPTVNAPAGVIQFHSEFETDTNGRGRLTISAHARGPKTPRTYIDGQLYGIGYQVKDLPVGYVANPFNFISILAWDRFDVPEHPTWFEHIQPILTQYANLYPIMSNRLVDLRDYDSVVGNLGIIRLGFSLPLDNPNSMPVTRDLSANKRRTILKWIDSKDPRTGLPPRGHAPSPPKRQKAAAAQHGEVVGSDFSSASDADFLRQVMNRLK